MAKAVNFGLLYGQGAAGLQEYASNSYGVDISMHEAEEYRAAWFESYPTFAHWHQQAWDIAPQSAAVVFRKPLRIMHLFWGNGGGGDSGGRGSKFAFFFFFKISFLQGMGRAFSFPLK